MFYSLPSEEKILSRCLLETFNSASFNPNNYYVLCIPSDQRKVQTVYPETVTHLSPPAI